MKKTFFIFAILALMLVTSGCSYFMVSNNKVDFDKKEFNIVTSFYPVYLSAINIAGDIKGVNVSCLINGNVGCLHDYMLTTEEMKSLEKADVLIINGADMEGFAEKIKSVYKDLKIIDASENIPLLENKFFKTESKYNSHLWLSISKLQMQVTNIAKKLAEQDSINGAKYVYNSNEYNYKLNSLKEKMISSFNSVPAQNKKIITYHEVLPYFAEEFGFEVIDVVASDDEESISPSKLSQVIKNIKTKGAYAIYAQPQIPIKTLNTILTEAKIKKIEFDTIASGEINNNKNAYIEKMEKNIETIILN